MNNPCKGVHVCPVAGKEPGEPDECLCVDVLGGGGHDGVVQVVLVVALDVRSVVLVVGLNHQNVVLLCKHRVVFIVSNTVGRNMHAAKGPLTKSPFFTLPETPPDLVLWGLNPLLKSDQTVMRLMSHGFVT